MEMRARQDLAMAEDLIPSLFPFAAALHDPYLSSHCSACFLPLKNHHLSCPSCTAVLYCSPHCRLSDHPLHLSSGECRLLATCQRRHTSDVRAALRLLQTLTLTRRFPNRIGWLSTDLDAEGIREGAEVMRRVKGKEEGEGEGEGVEEEVMGAVVRNAVEVEVGEGGAVGIAVYGPGFSWFNHSCVPNACYRFELGGCCGGEVDWGDEGVVRVWPASEVEEPEVVSIHCEFC